jgi:hypothetical protein
MLTARFGRVPVLALLAVAPVFAQSVPLADFERYAARAKQLGATHVVITNDIPPALWQFDTPGDPYPAWFVYQPAIMKIFPPAELRPYVDTAYAERIAALFEARCTILRKLGLKAVYSTNEPHVLPEKFFTDHPEMRGPRVDQPNRSRAARFAPCVDNAEVLRLYREAMQLLLKRLPEVEVFSLMTTDSGSGLCWSNGLYPGINGNSACRRRPMEDRVAGFLNALNEAARQMGRRIEVDLHGISPRQWMNATFDHPELIARRLPEGFSVEGLSGPDGRRVPAGLRVGGGGGEFAPVLGLGRPTAVIRSLMGAAGQKEPRLTVTISDLDSLDLSFRALEYARKAKPANEAEVMASLRGLASEIAGKENADDLLAVWLALDEADRSLSALNFGAAIEFGCVLARWINRPFVPFPGELTAEEKRHYRPFLFQAKGEEQADNLIDIQAMRMFEGWGAHLLVQRVIELADGSLSRAASAADRLRQAKTPAAPGAWELLANRIAALQSLVRSVDNAVAYQAQLDRVKALGIKPEPNPVLGVQSSWDRTDLLRIARSEIDNAIRLRSLLLSSKAPLLDTAPTAAEETIRKLGPDLPGQIKRKIDIMNAHWMDYDRLFTRPNP